MSQKYNSGIYQNTNGVRIKVLDIMKTQGWGEGITVMYFTNLPEYGKSYFGMEGESLKNFMAEFKRITPKKYRK